MQHPDPELLARLAAGTLEERLVPEIEGHLFECAHCCQLLESLPQPELAERLHRAYQHQGGLLSIPESLCEHLRYQVEEFLGSGGMGIVFKARHRLMDRTVALKIVRRALMARPGAVERFLREVKAAASLQHPNIVTAYDADQAGDLHFLVMEFVEGISLTRLVEQRGPLPVEQACACVRQAAMGLQHAHERGMVHRDIKPHNLMVTPTGQVKILDFGLARFASEPGAEGTSGNATLPPGSATATGAILGTAGFMAPEQATDPRQADVRSDIYSLGRTLEFLLSGRLPGTLTATPIPTSPLPAELGKILARMTAERPEQRYQTAAELAAGLAPLASRGGSRPLGRLRMLGALCVLVVILGCSLFMLVPALLNPSQPDQSEKRESHSVNENQEHVVTVSQQGRSVGEEIAVTRNADVPTFPQGHRVFRALPETSTHSCFFRGATFRADGQRVYAVDQMGRPFWWDVEGKGHHSGQERTGNQMGAAFGRNGSAGGQTLLLVRDQDGGVGLWDADLEKCLATRQIEQARRGESWPLALSADGRRAACAGRDGGLCWWDWPDGPVHVLPEAGAWAFQVVFLPDGKHVACATYGGIRVVDLEKGQEVFRLPLGEARVMAMAVSPDGQHLACGLTSDEIVLWDLGTRQRSVLGQRRSAAGENFVSALAFSPDGKRLLSGSARTVHLWQLGSEQEQARWQATGTVKCLAVSPDGRLVLAGTVVGELFLWLLP